MSHLRRMASRAFSRRSAAGYLREVRCIATHLALFPLGFVNRPLEHAPGDDDRDTYDLPVILVHGYFHNRSGFFFMSRELRRQGFRWVYGMNYNPIGESIPSLASRLARHVEEVKAASGAPRVHLVGHSLGGLIARYYVQEMQGAEHVSHCVTLGTPHHGTLAAYAGLGRTAVQMRPRSPILQRLDVDLSGLDVTFVNIYSDLDVLIVPPDSAHLPEADNVHNHLLHDLGHTSLLISTQLTQTVVRHLADADVSTPLADIHTLPAAAGAEDTRSQA